MLFCYCKYLIRFHRDLPLLLILFLGLIPFPPNPNPDLSLLLFYFLDGPMDSGAGVLSMGGVTVRRKFVSSPFLGGDPDPALNLWDVV